MKLGRIQIFNNWSPYMVGDPENTVWIGLEYFCTEGDDFWNMSEADCVRFATDELITMGVIKEFQGRGIDSLFYYYSYKNGLPKGYFRGEFSWVLENNTMMIRVAEMLDAVPYKTYRIYDKAISN